MVHFYKGKRGWYCRKCIRFLISEKQLEDSLNVVDPQYQLKFQLTKRQQDISNRLTAYVLEGHSVLLEAVCGAGKTELVYQCIAEMLKRGKKVGFAIPRRQVVLEIAQRFQEVFSKLQVVAVCQGYTKQIMGDIIVLTTHQLYRYHQYFDLLVIDEPDAFPFKGNIVLQGMAQKSVKGVKVYLSATPDETLLKQVREGEIQYLYLSKRPTGKDMVVPQAIYAPKIILWLGMMVQLYRLQQQRKQTIVFVPTIKQARWCYRVLKLFFSCCYIDSKVENKDEVIRDFKDKKYDVIIATTILERGITIKSVNLIVYQADHGVFDEASLVQMAGRVGRSVQDPYGVCLFLAEKRERKIDQCIQRIIKANDD